jgi:hypothetical protein
MSLKWLGWWPFDVPGIAAVSASERSGMKKNEKKITAPKVRRDAG